MTGYTTVTIAAVGALTSAAGAMAQGKATSDAANYNAQLNAQNALASQRAAAEQAKRQERLRNKRAGTNRAHDPDKLDLLEDNAIEEELAIQDTLHAGLTQSIGFGNNANLDRSSAANARRSGTTNAFGSLLSGAGDIAAT